MTSDTSPRPIISPLRARMIEDMSVRGFKEDTRALQLWLGHKSIQHTVRYSELSAERFKDW